MTESPSPKIMTHPDRLAIEADGLAHPSKVVCRLHGLNQATVLKHTRWLKAEIARKESMSEVDRLAESLDVTRRRLEDVLDWVNRNKRNESGFAEERVLKVVRELRSTIEAIAKIRGITKTGVQVGVGVNINGGGGQPHRDDSGVAPDEVKAAIMRGLSGHPEARDSVVRELLALERRHGGPPLIEGVADDVADRAG